MPFLGIDTITLLTTAFWIWMMADCLLHKRVKIGWFLFILFTHMIGAGIYYWVACSQRNPVDAFHYYVQRLTGSGKLNKVKPAAKKQPQPFSPTPTYTPYQQGYQASVPEAPTPMPPMSPTYPAPTYQATPEAYNPQPEYEQPTTTYPEMPPQQMH